MRAIASLSLVSLFLSSVLVPAHAARFSDISSGHRFSLQIEALAKAGVVTGNPDGSFKPDNTVNRAAMLAMLYRAKNEQPSAPKNGCGSDVVKGSWYEGYVCDAIAKKFVQGYSDGFKPEQVVTRAEALKMAFAVLRIPADELAKGASASKTYKDVPALAWFHSYVSAALAIDILPLPGDSATVFGPEKQLTRGEAAAYVYGVMEWNDAPGLGMASSSQMARRSQASSKAASSGNVIKDVDLPFSDDGVFSGKVSRIYRFPLSAKTTTEITTSVASGSVSCRLFKLDSDGTSQEYYLGDETDSKCVLRVTLAPGSYQLDLKPSQADASFSVTSRTVTGDGNDGFTEAKKLQGSKALSDALSREDMTDWYTFTLKSKGTYTLHLSNEAYFDCIIYAMKDVDLSGFTGPECNVSFEYPAGTYYIGVVRGDAVQEHEYSIWLD